MRHTAVLIATQSDNLVSILVLCGERKERTVSHCVRGLIDTKTSIINEQLDPLIEKKQNTRNKYLSERRSMDDSLKVGLAWLA